MDQLPNITTLDEAVMVIRSQHAQLVWLTAAVHQLQRLFSPDGVTTPGQRQISSDPNRVEVGMGSIPTPTKSSFV